MGLTTTPLTPSDVLAFEVMPVVLALALTWAVWATTRAADGPRAAWRAARTTLLAAAAWMTATWVLASAGVFQHWDRTPPPFALLVAAIVLLACAIAFSRVGHRIAQRVPLWALVGVQGFRLPLELAMHSLYERGVMPVQMSYSGRNFDIVSGSTAILVAAAVAAGAAGRTVVRAWNVLGLALLANIVTVAILSTPRVRFFGPDKLNVFVLTTPFVWLPAVMVLAALAGHLLIFRRLWSRPSTSGA